MMREIVFRTIDMIVLLTMAYLVFRENAHLHEVFGGSFFFFPLIAIFMYFSYIFKRFQLELSCFSAICMLLISMNYLAYLEETKTLQMFYAIVIFIALGVLLGVLFLILGFSPIKFHVEDNNNLMMFKKSIFLLYSIPYCMGGLGYCFPIGLVFYLGARDNYKLIYDGILEYSLIALYLLVFSHVVLFRYLKKVDEKQLDSVIEDRETVDVYRHKNKLIAGSVLFFLFGSVFEIYRGLWLFWLGTNALFMEDMET